MMEELELCHNTIKEMGQKFTMTCEQTDLIISRYLRGDITVLQGMLELEKAQYLIEKWKLGDPLPFGEID